MLIFTKKYQKNLQNAISFSFLACPRGFFQARAPKLIRKKWKNVFRFFEKLVRCEGVSIFRLGLVGKVGVDSGWVVAGYETHRVSSYDLDTPSDALENQIGPSVWPL